MNDRKKDKQIEVKNESKIEVKNELPIIEEKPKESVGEDFSELLKLRTGLINEFAINNKAKIPAIIACEKKGRNRGSLIARLDAIINPVDESKWDAVDFCQRLNKKKRHEVAFVVWLKEKNLFGIKLTRTEWEKIYKMFMP